jgi:acyl carrier protein|tara:strand:- start:258 stop:515 length:258 start_codon:yes stop_codon:yes gene_type:complete
MSELSKEETIIGQLRGILEESSVNDLDWNTFSSATSIEEIGLDSLTILDLLYDIEETIGIPLEAKQVLKITTVGEIVTLLIAEGA